MFQDIVANSGKTGEELDAAIAAAKEIDIRIAEVINAIIERGYPEHLLNIETQEIPDDDPEVGMRGGMVLIFTCTVGDTEWEIPVDLSYEEFLLAIENESNTEG